MTQKRNKTTKRAAQGLVGLNVILTLAALALYIFVHGSPDTEFGDVWPLSAFVYSLLAILILARHPRHTVGWLFILIGFAMAMTTLGIYGIGPAGEPSFDSKLALFIYVFVSELIWIVALLTPLTLVLPYFPDGQLPSRRWRPIPVAAVLGMLLMAAGFAIEYSGINASQGLQDLLSTLSGLLTITAIVGSVASAVVRFIRSKDIARLQMKWVAYTALTGVSLSFVLLALRGPDDPFQGLIFSMLPIFYAAAIAVAILRYRLYDIDLLIRRTVQYGLVTGILALVYFGMVVVFQGLFAAVGDQQSEIFIVISTLIIASLFNPLRRRVQQAIDRRFYRQKYDAELALARFAAATRDEVDLERLTAALVQVVDETMQPEAVGLWLAPDER